MGTMEGTMESSWEGLEGGKSDIIPFQLKTNLKK